MLVNIIAREIIVVFAFQDWMLVRRFFKIIESNGDREGIEWKKTHVFFANMGGFVMTFKELKDDDVFYHKDSARQVLQEVSKIEKEWTKSSILVSEFHMKRLEKVLRDDKLKAPIQPMMQDGKPFAPQCSGQDFTSNL